MTWTEDKQERLRELWTAGKSANEIAEILRISRNAVLGKVNRLGLESRASPITTHRDRFEQLVDFITNRPDQHFTVAQAAQEVGMNVYMAELMWKDFIVRFAYHPDAGLELYP